MRMNTIDTFIGSCNSTSSLLELGASFYSWEKLTKENIPILVPLGCDDNGLWLSNFDRHILVAGQTGSGKTVSVLANSILLASKSREAPKIVAIDAKPTLHRLSADALEDLGYKVIHVDLRNADCSDHFNPLLPIWNAFKHGDAELVDALMDNLMGSLTVPVRDSQQPFWENCASNLIAGYIYALFEKGDKAIEPTLHDVSKLIASGPRSISRIEQEMKSPTGKMLLSGAISSLPARETTGGIFVVAQTMLAFYSNSLGRCISGESGIDIECELLSDDPCAIFLTCPDEAGLGARSYASLFFDTVYQCYIRGYEKGLASPKGVRIVFDEFPSFPKCSIGQVLATARSRNLFVMAGVQSTSQLAASGYSKDEREAMLSQFGGCIILRNTDSLLGSIASLRTDGFITPGDLIDLDVGEGLVIWEGGLSARTRLPYFYDLEDRGVFGKSEMSILRAQEALSSNDSQQSGSSYISEEKAIRYKINQIVQSVFVQPEPLCSKWVEEYCCMVRRNGSYLELCGRIKELADRATTLPIDDIRYCGLTLAKQFVNLQKDSPLEASLLCKKTSDEELPFVPGLGDTLYREMLLSFLQIEDSSGNYDFKTLCDLMFGFIGKMAKQTCVSFDNTFLLSAIPLGVGLRSIIAFAKEKSGSGSVQAQKALSIILESSNKCNSYLQAAFSRCIGHYASSEFGTAFGSLLFEDSEEGKQLTRWVLTMAAFSPLCKRDLLPELRRLLTESPKNAEIWGQSR